MGYYTPETIKARYTPKEIEQSLCVVPRDLLDRLFEEVDVFDVPNKKGKGGLFRNIEGAKAVICLFYWGVGSPEAPQFTLLHEVAHWYLGDRDENDADFQAFDWIREYEKFRIKLPQDQRETYPDKSMLLDLAALSIRLNAREEMFAPVLARKQEAEEERIKTLLAVVISESGNSGNAHPEWLAEDIIEALKARGNNICLRGVCFGIS